MRVDVGAGEGWGRKEGDWNKRVCASLARRGNIFSWFGGIVL